MYSIAKSFADICCLFRVSKALFLASLNLYDTSASHTSSTMSESFMIWCLDASVCTQRDMPPFGVSESV